MKKYLFLIIAIIIVCGCIETQTKKIEIPPWIYVDVQEGYLVAHIDSYEEYKDLWEGNKCKYGDFYKRPGKSIITGCSVTDYWKYGEKWRCNELESYEELKCAHVLNYEVTSTGAIKSMYCGWDEELGFIVLDKYSYVAEVEEEITFDYLEEAMGCNRCVNDIVLDSERGVWVSKISTKKEIVTEDYYSFGRIIPILKFDNALYVETGDSEIFFVVDSD